MARSGFREIPMPLHEQTVYAANVGLPIFVLSNRGHSEQMKMANSSGDKLQPLKLNFSRIKFNKDRFDGIIGSIDLTKWHYDKIHEIFQNMS